MNTRNWKLIVPALALAVAGCGGAGKPVKVEGVVTLDGTPVDGASVLFTPVEKGDKVRPAQGVTGADGKFELTTLAPNDGALPGEYKVTVTYTPQVDLDQPGKNVQEAFMGVSKAKLGAARKPPKYVIPPAYTNVNSTPITQKVPADGTVTLALTGGGKS